MPSRKKRCNNRVIPIITPLYWYLKDSRNFDCFLGANAFQSFVQIRSFYLRVYVHFPFGAVKTVSPKSIIQILYSSFFQYSNPFYKIQSFFILKRHFLLVIFLLFHYVFYKLLQQHYLMQQEPICLE